MIQQNIDCLYKYIYPTTDGAREKIWKAIIRTEKEHMHLLIKQVDLDAADKFIFGRSFFFEAGQSQIEIDGATYSVQFNSAHRCFYKYDDEYAHIGVGRLVDKRIYSDHAEECVFRLYKTSNVGYIKNNTFAGITIVDCDEYFQITIENKENEPIEQLSEKINKIRSLFTFLTGQSFYQDDIIFKVNGEFCKDVYISGMKTHNFATTMYTNGRIKEIESLNIAELCYLWVSDKRLDESTIKDHNVIECMEVLHTNSLRFPQMWFMQTFSMLEAFFPWYLEKKEIDICEKNDAKYNALKKSIEDIVSKSDLDEVQKTDMTSRFNLLNENAVKKKFDKLCKKVHKIINHDPIDKTIIDAIVETRNLFTHGTARKPNKKYIDNFVFAIWYIRELVIAAILCRVFENKTLQLQDDDMEYSIFTLTRELQGTVPNRNNTLTITLKEEQNNG